MNLCSVSFLVSVWLLCLTASIRTRSLEDATAFPTLQPPEAETESTPNDLTLTFDTTLSESDAAPETTTSVSSSSSVVVKSGRHYGSRLQSVSVRTTVPTPLANNIPINVKSRPISYNPTNYNRILKRRQNHTSTVITQEVSTSISDGATESTVSAQLRTTSAPPSQTTLKNYAIFHSETDVPTTTSNPEVNLTVRVPTLPTSVSKSAELQSTTPANVNAPQVKVNDWGPIPPPPTFDPEDDFTVYPDGIYKFRYSSSSTPSSTLTTSRNYTEEIDKKSDTHLNNDEEDEEGSGSDQDLPTAQLSSTDEIVPATSAPTAITLPTIDIDGSEDDVHAASPVYRNYFPEDEEKIRRVDVPVKKEIKEVTVTVTVTEKANLSQSASSIEKIEEITVSTPILQKIDASSIEFVTETFTIVPTSVQKVVDTLSDEGHTDAEQQEHSIFAVTSPPVTFDLEPTPILNSNDFKSVFFSTESNSHFTSTQFTYSSSTEFSFTFPDDHHSDDEGHQHEERHEQIHNLDENHTHADNHHHDVDSPHHHKLNEQKNLIQPTTSTFYWDSSVQTVQLNDSEPIRHEVPLGVTTPQSTHVELNDIQKAPEPTITSASSPDEETKKVTTQGTPPIDLFEATKVPEHDTGGMATTVKLLDKVDEDLAPPYFFHLPSVPSYIQILLDIQPTQFCSNIKEFKETIVLVYKYNNRQISLDQVVVYQEPPCTSSFVTSYKTRSAKPTNSNSSPATNSASNAKANAKDLDTDDDSKNWRENVSDLGQLSSAPSLYSVYVYILHKNGTYDQFLTEAFIDLWNLTRIDGLLLFDKIKKVEMIISSDLGGSAPTNQNTGVIAAITVASVAAFCLLILGILLLVMRHRQAQNNFAKRCTPVTLDDYSLDNISVFNSFRRKQRNRSSKRSYTNAGFDDPNTPSRPLDVDGLGIAVKDVNGIYDEFSRIPNVLPTLDDIPIEAESKNRYANVIPMPDTRVLLTFQDEQPNSDYINANFVQGYNANSKAYIITQGPLEETLLDFWRMIWEQQVRVIFMVTDFAEAGIPKCAEYYPRSETIECSQLHGDFQVTLEKREVAENCTTSFLVLKDMARNLRRDLVHLWFHSWPEKGIPQNPQSTVDFLLKSRKYTRENTPILVHCSPGTGRSGTVVACDIGMRQLDSDRKVDIPQIVKQLRHDRAGAVQTKDQYRHIYELLHHYGVNKYSSRLTKDT